MWFDVVEIGSNLTKLFRRIKSQWTDEKIECEERLTIKKINQIIKCEDSNWIRCEYKYLVGFSWLPMTVKDIFLKPASPALFLYSISLVLSMPKPQPGPGMIKEAME